MSSTYLPKHTGSASASSPSPAVRFNLNAIDGPSSSRRNSRNRDNGLYDPNKPVLLHEHIIDGDIASAEVLMDFGFALCDEDADIWFHPHTQLQCQSKDLCCRWKRNTILRCSVTTDITRKDKTLGWVTDLEPLGSLQHPPCLNSDCRLNKPHHIMRLERNQLVSRILSDPEKDALLSRKRDKWFGQFQDEYPMRIGVLPFSRDPNERPITKTKKRKLRQSLKSTSSLATHSHTPEAGPSRIQFDPVSEYIGDQPHAGRSYDTGDAQQARDIKPSIEPEQHLPRAATTSLPRAPRTADNQADNDLEGYPETTRLTDHYLIPAWEFDRMQAEKTVLRSRVAELEQEANRQEKTVLKQDIADLKKDNADLKKERDGFKEEARAARKLVEELKSKALQLFR